MWRLNLQNMKKIRQLRVHPGQQLSSSALNQIMAGNSQWHGACQCAHVGNSHTEMRTETYTYTDFSRTIVGGLCVAGAIGAFIATDGLSAGYSVALGQYGCGLILNGIKVTSTIHYYRQMELTYVKPMKHKVARSWTSTE